jgi:hypothetical protein
VRMFPPFFRFSILNKIARRKVPKLKTKLKNWELRSFAAEFSPT